MQRAIVVPAILAPGALDELKQWLAISTTQDDSSLLALLHASLDMCEAFTGQMPLAVSCDETRPAVRDWQTLATRPVRAITAVEGIASNGTRTVLPVDSYEMDIDAHGTARTRLTRRISETRITVRLSAGIASDWASLPDALRQGILGLAAHRYRQRDIDSAKSHPPAAIAALWSPWRLMRLT